MAHGLKGMEIVRPASTGDAAEALRSCGEQDLGMFPLGGWTFSGYGAQPRGPGKVLDTTGLLGPLEFSPKDLTVRAGAGWTLEALNQELEGQGQFVPLESPIPSRATVGGVLSLGMSGPRRLCLGIPKDWILGLTLALPNGEIVHGGGQVVKNVAGYDLPRLCVGACGTMGLICEAVFRTLPLPQETRLYSSRPESLESALEAVHGLGKSDLPLSLCDLLWNGEEDVQIFVELSGRSALLEKAEKRLGTLLQSMGITSEESKAYENLRDLTLSADHEVHVQGAFPISRSVEALKSFAASALSWLETPILRLHALSGVLDLLGRAQGDDGSAGLSELRNYCEAPAMDGSPLGSLRILKVPGHWQDVPHPWGGSEGLRRLATSLRKTVDPGEVLNRDRFP